MRWSADFGADFVTSSAAASDGDVAGSAGAGIITGAGAGAEAATGGALSIGGGAGIMIGGGADVVTGTATAAEGVGSTVTVGASLAVCAVPEAAARA